DGAPCTEISALSLHDALPICGVASRHVDSGSGRLLSSSCGTMDVVAGPSERMLALLSLLQARRDWPGHVLAQRLDVTTRTVRRRSEEHTSELQSRENLVCRLL